MGSGRSESWNGYRAKSGKRSSCGFYSPYLFISREGRKPLPQERKNVLITYVINFFVYRGGKCTDISSPFTPTGPYTRTSFELEGIGSSCRSPSARSPVLAERRAAKTPVGPPLPVEEAPGGGKRGEKGEFLQNLSALTPTYRFATSRVLLRFSRGCALFAPLFTRNVLDGNKKQALVEMS